MKKTIKIFIVLLLCSISSYAQQKGDMYFEISAKASFGSMDYSAYQGGNYQRTQKPEETSLGIQIEGSSFISDNFRLSLAIGVPFVSSPTNSNGNQWGKVKAIGIQINPNIAGYFKLAERFYYTPELGADIELGTFTLNSQTLTPYDINYTGWSIYLHFFALEFRVTDKIALGATIGSISYAFTNCKDRDPMNTLQIKNTHFSLNDSSISLKYYF